MLSAVSEVHEYRKWSGEGIRAYIASIALDILAISAFSSSFARWRASEETGTAFVPLLGV